MEWYDVITDQYIKNAAIGYMQDAPLEVFDMFPKVSTQKMTGQIPKYVKEDWFKIGNLDEYRRTGSTESIGDDFASARQSYDLEQFSFHKDVTKTDQEQMESPYDATRDAVKFVVNRLRRVALKLVDNEFMVQGVWGNEEVNPDKWSDTSDSGSDPIDQVMGWKQTIESTTGFSPNSMIITPDCWKALMLHPNITDKLAVTQTQIPTRQAVASMFELDRLVVLNAVNEDASGYFSSKKALLTYTPTNAGASKFEPSAGYIMTYTGHNAYDIGTKRMPMPERNDSLRIEADFYLDPVIPAGDCGYFIDDLVS